MLRAGLISCVDVKYVTSVSFLSRNIFLKHRVQYCIENGPLLRHSRLELFGRHMRCILLHVKERV